MDRKNTIHHYLPFKLITLLMLFSFLKLGSTTDINQTSNKVIENNTIKQNVDQFPDFDTFIIKYNKKYDKGTPEYEKRKLIYEQRVKKLQQIQNNPNITHQVCINKFSDLSEEERQSRKPLLTMTPPIKQTPLLQSMSMNQLSAIGTPSSLDWRQQGIVTSVKDQGQCGSCWTFATCAYGQSRLVQQNLAPPNISLSQQYLLTCTKQCTCRGGYLQYVFEKAADGVPTQSDYPYHPYIPASPFMCWTNKKIHFGYIPQKYYNINDQDLTSLLQKGPVAISLSGTNWQDYKGGVFRCNNNDKVNHAVLLVGYTPDYWIVKNQWGVNWGQKGYMRITRNPLYNCKIGSSAFIMAEIFQLFFTFSFLIFAFIVY